MSKKENTKEEMMPQCEEFDPIAKDFTVVLKGKFEDKEYSLDNTPLNLDHPAVVMARRVASLFMQDHEIIKISLTYYGHKYANGMTPPNTETLGKVTIYCVNHLKSEALKLLLQPTANNVVDIEIHDFANPKYGNDEIVRAAFKGNPVISDVRTVEHAESGLKFIYGICDRKYLCQFNTGNAADYQANFTELPQDILNKIKKHQFGINFCTEV